MFDLLDTMLMIADLNAQEARLLHRRRGLVLVPAAKEENAEWEAFTAKQQARHKALGLGELDVRTDDLEEDDADALIAIMAVLTKSRAKGADEALTVSEIVRELQHNKVLSLEFAATARAQAMRLLAILRSMHKAGQDKMGRWALL